MSTASKGRDEEAEEIAWDMVMNEPFDTPFNARRYTGKDEQMFSLVKTKIHRTINLHGKFLVYDGFSYVGNGVTETRYRFTTNIKWQKQYTNARLVNPMRGLAASLYQLLLFAAAQNNTKANADRLMHVIDVVNSMERIVQ